MDYAQEREGVLAAARYSVEVGLTHGTSGNVSARVVAGMVITPTGLAYGALTAAEIVLVTLDGTVASGERRAPSSEWPMHAAIYVARPDVAAVVHGHSPAAVAFSCLRRDLPAFHYMVAAAGGDTIRCAEYATFGTDQLARSAVAALAGRRACYLANHGFLAVGSTLDQAVSLAVEVEFLADAFLRLVALREPPRLSGPEMKRILERFATYGQQPARK